MSLLQRREFARAADITGRTAIAFGCRPILIDARLLHWCIRDVQTEFQQRVARRGGIICGVGRGDTGAVIRFEDQ